MQTTANDIKQHEGPGSSHGVAVAALLTLTVVAAGALAGWWTRVVTPGLATLTGAAPARPADALLTCVAAAAFLLGCWLVLGLLLDLLSRAPGAVGRIGESLAEAITPRLARQVIAAMLGLGASTVLLPPASVAQPPAVTATATVSTALTGTTEPAWVAPSAPPAASPETSPSTGPGWVAPAPTVRPQPDPHTLTGPGWPPTGDGEIVVHRGDTLWDLTARHLGPGATADEIAREWPRWFAANRHIIGNDPDLLLPGQVLQIPDPVGSPS